MIKKGVRIKSFTADQQKQLEEISAETGIKCTKNILLHLLESYTDHKNEVARLNRFLQYKQNKINRLENPGL